jgi:TPR repeat protein
MAHDVFISYSAHDKPAADAICAKLESRGIRCWIAPRDIKPGMTYGGAIIDSIDAARVMVLLFSADAGRSPQVMREVERAVHKELVIVPVRLEDVRPSGDFEYFLSTPHWLDAITPPFDSHLDRVADSVGYWLGKTATDGAPSRPALPSPAPATTSRTTGKSMRGPAIALVVVAMVGIIRAAVFATRKFEAHTERAALAEADANVDRIVAKIAHGEAPELAGSLDASDVDAIRRAAESKDPQQERRLGAIDQFGLGAPKNDLEAFQWISKAAIAGDPTAQNNLGAMYRDGTGVITTYPEALRWFQMAAAQGSAPAEANLGNMYASGWGVQRDDSEAVKWFQKSAEQGDATGENYLGWMYAKGRGVGQDYGEGLNWIRRAADQHDASAENNLGKMYENGWGADKSYDEALRCYRRAAEHGYGPAEYNIGRMHENGLGVHADRHTAEEWYRKAAAHGDSDAKDSLAHLAQSP